MKAIPTSSPTSVAAIDQHETWCFLHNQYVIQYGGPQDRQILLFTPDGSLDINLLAVLKHRLTGFQEGSFACSENEIALSHVETALLTLECHVFYKAPSFEVLDEKDPNAGNANHAYNVQPGGSIQFQHGPRGVVGSTPGIFEDDLLAILEDRMEIMAKAAPGSHFPKVAGHLKVARTILGTRLAARMARGILGLNIK